MATNFPSSLDSLTNPTSSDSLASPSHAAQHANVNDAVEALQAKVGVDSSAVTTSLDYKVAQLEAISHGKILQVVRATKNTDFTTSSLTLVDVPDMSVTITPTATSSAILIVTAFTNVHYSNTTNNTRGVYVIADAANNPISGTNNAVVGAIFTGTGTITREFWSTVNLVAYDTPATTSATTYKLQLKAENANANARVAGNTNLAQMYALEVSA